MSKQIEFEYEGKTYTLEYNRAAIKFMESRGFSFEKWSTAPASMIEMAFEGAFYKNHKNISIAKITEIYEKMSDKKVLNDTLAEMIADSYTELFGDNEEEEGEGKNIGWKTV